MPISINDHTAGFSIIKQNLIRNLIAEIAKVQSMGKIPPKDMKYVDIYREKPIKVTVKVLVPVREHPKVSDLSIYTLVLTCEVTPPSSISWVNCSVQKGIR